MSLKNFRRQCQRNYMLRNTETVNTGSEDCVRCGDTQEVKVKIDPVAIKFVRYAFLTAIIILILTFSLTVQKVEGYSSDDYEVPIYKIPVPESVQRDIWTLSEDNNLSYELVLAIFRIDNVTNYQIGNIKAKIESFAYYRDYWSDQQCPDEIVFDLMLLSIQRGIGGCVIFVKNNNSGEMDDYVQKVTEYKYYLEQSLDAQPAYVVWQNLVPVRVTSEKSEANVKNAEIPVAIRTQSPTLSLISIRSKDITVSNYRVLRPFLPSTKIGILKMIDLIKGGVNNGTRY